MLKKYNKATRIDQGNKRAECVRSYLNHRFPNLNLITYDGTLRDKNDGEDFGNDDFTLQCKVRDSGDDTIYETDQYHATWKEGKIIECTHKPGRDARTKAKFYVCKPVKENCLTLPTTKSVKEIIQKVTEEWGVTTSKGMTYNGVGCTLIDFSNEQVEEYWKSASGRMSLLLFKSEKYKPAQVYFKIEEGDSKPYGKLLFYIPIAVSKGKAVYLFEGENLYDESTWV